MITITRTDTLQAITIVLSFISHAARNTFQACMAATAQQEMVRGKGESGDERGAGYDSMALPFEALCLRATTASRTRVRLSLICRRRNQRYDSEHGQ
jgi:hypothetical protein